MLRPPMSGVRFVITASIWLDNYYMSRAATIFGGSSQMQRNTIGEHILGLDREPVPTGTESR